MAKLMNLNNKKLRQFVKNLIAANLSATFLLTQIHTQNTPDISSINKSDLNT